LAHHTTHARYAYLESRYRSHIFGRRFPRLIS
jgi:hypothetical protein